MPVTLICGDARDWEGGGVDLVLTNPYAALPKCLADVPALVSNFAERKTLCEKWMGGELTEIGIWGRRGRNRVWVKGLRPQRVALDDLVEDEIAPGRGFFPLDLPLRLLTVYATVGMTIWDGFAGRGTVGKACQRLGMNFIGIDRDPERVALARNYLAAHDLGA